jgi:hypothetical protein
MTNAKVQLVCAWCGPISMLLFTVGFWPIAGFIPPPSPAEPAAQLRQFYAESPNMARLGLVIVIAAGAVTGPFVSVLTSQMRRVTGQDSPLPNLQLGMGMLGIILFIWPVLVLQAAIYRPERKPDLILLASDMGWLPFVGIFALAFVQCMAVAATTFLDHEALVFPRWVAYFNIWVALLFLPGGLVYFFKDGPFAWNGIFALYIPAVAFCGWFFVMFVPLRSAILRQAQVSTETAHQQ